MTKYFAGVADEVKGSVVRVPELSSSGIVWEPRRVVTTSVPDVATPGPINVHRDAETSATQPELWRPNPSLATLTRATRPAGSP